MTSLVVVPVFFTLNNSFKTDSQSLNNSFSLPAPATLSNYKYVIIEKSILRYAKNSFLVCCFGLWFCAAINPFVSFMIVNHWEKRIYHVLYVILSACMFIPANLLLFPIIRQFYNWNLMNRLGLILYYAAFVMPESVFMLVPFMRTFNRSIRDAALLDGCTRMKYYLYIFLPMCRSINITVLIFNAVWMWNDFFMPLMVLNRDPDIWTLPIYIYSYLGRNTTHRNIAFAACWLALLPIIILYLFFHKRIIHGLYMQFTKIDNTIIR